MSNLEDRPSFYTVYKLSNLSEHLAYNTMRWHFNRNGTFPLRIFVMWRQYISCNFPTGRKMFRPGFKQGISWLKLPILFQLIYPGQIWITYTSQIACTFVASLLFSHIILSRQIWLVKFAANLPHGIVSPTYMSSLLWNW